MKDKVISAKVTPEEYHIIGLMAVRAKKSISLFAHDKILKEDLPSLFEQGGSIVPVSTVPTVKTKEDEAIIKKIESLKEELKIMTENRDKWKKDWNSRKAKYDKLEIEFNEFKNKIGNGLEPISKRIKSLVLYSETNCKDFTPDLNDAVKEIEAIQTKLLK
jgi:hypothetical protein